MTPAQSNGRVLAVFADETAARQAIEEAESAIGHSLDARIGSSDDEVAALRAEMREEISHSFVGPGNIGPFTKEMARGLTLGSVIGGVIGGAIGLAIALPVAQNVNLGLRILVGLLVGVFAGSTLGFELGGGLGARGPAQPLAGERGVPVSVENQGGEIVEAFRRHHPIRLDLLDSQDAPAQTLATEEDHPAEGTVEDLTGKLGQGEGDWSPIRDSDA